MADWNAALTDWAEFAALRTELLSEAARLAQKIEIAVRDMTIRTGGTLIALFAALALIRFFGH